MEDEAHHLRALTLQATGDGIGSVAEFPHRFVDLGTGIFAQIAAVIEYAGDRGGETPAGAATSLSLGFATGAPFDMLND